jgi:4'-phosphopantetheinyl transferase
LKEVDAFEDDLKHRPPTSWSHPSSRAQFPVGRIDIWKVQLDQLETLVSQTNNLSSDEIARANRFHFEKDKGRFAQCRSVLRDILSDYLGIPGAEIRFEYLKGGKPRVVVDQNPGGLQFNVSHSANVALIAVGSEHQLGVDIEKIRSDVDDVELAERFFSVRERSELGALPDHLRLAGFFACWTRKEAFLKATGDGLSFPLTDFSVTTHPESEPRLEEIKGNTEVGNQWFLADLRGIDGFRATVAVEHSYALLGTYVWNDSAVNTSARRQSRLSR